VEWVVLSEDGGEGEGARKWMGEGCCSCGGGEMSEILGFFYFYERVVLTIGLQTGWPKIGSCLCRATVSRVRPRPSPTIGGRAGPRHYPLRAEAF
jgi:hypothetical protein